MSKQLWYKVETRFSDTLAVQPFQVVKETPARLVLARVEKPGVTGYAQHINKADLAQKGFAPNPPDAIHLKLAEIEHQLRVARKNVDRLQNWIVQLHGHLGA